MTLFPKLARLFKVKKTRKKKRPDTNEGSSTPVPTTEAEPIDPDISSPAHLESQANALKPVNLATVIDHGHGQDGDNTTHCLVSKADNDARVGLSTIDKTKNPPEENNASKVKAKNERGEDAPLQSSEATSSKVQVLSNGSNFKIEKSQFISARRDVRAINYSDMLLTRIAYADGAGIDMTKACLTGTRVEILAKIKGWMTSTDVTTPRVLWLSGPAGKGKSAIAHSIARWWMEENNGIGSCFCFNRQATTRHERLFTTIAVDLAARIPGLKGSLIKLITSDPALAATVDVTQQWQKFLQGPLTSLPESLTEPVVIVIDALDESGRPASRRHILSILTKDMVKLPSNFRVLVTSRPVPDIGKVFHNANGVRLESMDEIPASSTNLDIQLYFSWRLQSVEGFGDPEFLQLAWKSDGLFEWARLACEHIGSAQGPLTERERFEQLIEHAGEGKELLDNTYRIILRSILGDHPSDSTIDRFRSVLRMVLSTLEPLPMDSLNILHRVARRDHSRYDVATVLSPLGSLLSGVSGQPMAVRPLHATFHEFLTSCDRGGRFFVDVEDVNSDLAHACLQVMQQHLRFNICKLESSYVCNSEISDLGERTKNCIKPYLAYSCQFWADHIEPTAFQVGLADQIKAFLLNEEILFWLETLSLLKLISMVPTMLSNVARWLKAKDGYEDASTAARDGIRFARMVGGIISESTPHLYLSGLPFLPTNSILGRLMKAKFSRIPRVVGGAVDWHPLELSIRGHTSSVNSVAFSHDGKIIASGSDDLSIHIWDAVTGLQVGSPLKGHTGAVNSVAFSPDGKRIASGSDDQTVCIWDVETGLQVGNALKGHTSWIKSVAFSPDRKRIASASEDKMIYIWDAETGLQVGNPLKGHAGCINSVTFSPDGKRIASCSDDKTIYIWDAKTGLQVSDPLKGHTSWVNSVAFSPDGKRIASVSHDRTVCIWDLEIGFKLQVGPLKGHTGSVNSVVFSPDGKKIASGSHDRTVHIWDAETGLQVGNPLKGHTSAVKSVTFSPDGERIASASDDQRIFIWDATGLKMGNPLKGHTSWVNSVAFSPDGRRIVSGSFDQIIYIWDAETGLQVGNPLKGHTDGVKSIALSPDGKRIASGSFDKTIHIWDAETGLQMKNALKGHTRSVKSVAFSPDGKRIASGSDDQMIYMWDAETGLQVGNPLKGHTGSVNSVTFSPDGKRIASGSYDQTVCMWDAETGLQVGNPLKGHTSSVNFVTFSPDGKKVASCSEDQIIYIWDAETSRQVGNPLKGHTGSVNSVAFSPDGKRIASGSDDQTIYIWDAETGIQVGNSLKGHTGSVNSVTFSPDGKRIASGSSDHIIYVWDADPLHGTTSKANSIKFSSSNAHALCEAFWLFNGTSELQQDWREHVVLHPQGWITGPQHHLLMWIPEDKRRPLLLPKMHVTIPRQGIELDLSSMAHGHMWDKCYDG